MVHFYFTFIIFVEVSTRETIGINNEVGVRKKLNKKTLIMYLKDEFYFNNIIFRLRKSSRLNILNNKISIVFFL